MLTHEILKFQFKYIFFYQIKIFVLHKAKISCLLLLYTCIKISKWYMYLWFTDIYESILLLSINFNCLHVWNSIYLSCVTISLPKIHNIDLEEFYSKKYSLAVAQNKLLGCESAICQVRVIPLEQTEHNSQRSWGN